MVSASAPLDGTSLSRFGLLEGEESNLLTLGFSPSFRWQLLARWSGDPQW